MAGPKGVVPRSAFKKGHSPGNLKLTPDRCRLYFECLSKTGLKTKSAELAGVTYACIKIRRNKDAAFKEMEGYALEVFNESLEEKALELAFVGVKEPIYQKGILMGHRIRFSEKLAELLLKANMPEKYRENKIELDASGGLLIAPAKTSVEQWVKDEDRRMRKQREKQASAIDVEARPVTQAPPE